MILNSYRLPIVIWQEDNGNWLASCPPLECQNIKGASLEEAKTNLISLMHVILKSFPHRGSNFIDPVCFYTETDVVIEKEEER